MGGETNPRHQTRHQQKQQAFNVSAAQCEPPPPQAAGLRATSDMFCSETGSYRNPSEYEWGSAVRMATAWTNQCASMCAVLFWRVLWLHAAEAYSMFLFIYLFIWAEVAWGLFTKRRGWRPSSMFAQERLVTSHWIASRFSISATASLGIVKATVCAVYHKNGRPLTSRKGVSPVIHVWISDFSSPLLLTHLGKDFPLVYQSSCVINNRRGLVVVSFLRAGYRRGVTGVAVLRQP